MATLKQVKEKLGLNQLELVTANDVNGAPTDWLRHWDNDRRMAVSIHKDLAKELGADKTGAISALSLQHEQRVGEQGPYDAYRIVKFNSTPEVIL